MVFNIPQRELYLFSLITEYNLTLETSGFITFLLFSFVISVWFLPTLHCHSTPEAHIATTTTTNNIVQYKVSYQCNFHVQNYIHLLLFYFTLLCFEKYVIWCKNMGEFKMSYKYISDNLYTETLTRRRLCGYIK